MKMVMSDDTSLEHVLARNPHISPTLNEGRVEIYLTRNTVNVCHEIRNFDKNRNFWEKSKFQLLVKVLNALMDILVHSLDSMVNKLKLILQQRTYL